jgi:hypothetical protein
MGTYTEIIFGCELISEIPSVAINALKWLCGEIKRPEELPDHEFFNDKKNRWFLFQSGSFYFGVNKGVAEIWFSKSSNSWHVSARGNIKNYNNEIEKFLSWVRKYVDTGSGERNFYAIVCHEDQTEPSIYYLDSDEIEK